MTKIIAILTNVPIALSGGYVSSNRYYRDFVSNFNAGTVNFGSLSEDRSNYSKDVSNVFRDYKKAGLAYKRIKEGNIGKQKKAVK